MHRIQFPVKLASEMSKYTAFFCQGDAFIAELEAERASEISKASRKKNKQKKKGVLDPQLVMTQDLRT
jgi:hypothetical protein